METIASRKQDIKGGEEGKVKERPYAAYRIEKSGNVRWNQTAQAVVLQGAINKRLMSFTLVIISGGLFH